MYRPHLQLHGNPWQNLIGWECISFCTCLYCGSSLFLGETVWSTVIFGCTETQRASRRLWASTLAGRAKVWPAPDFTQLCDHGGVYTSTMTVLPETIINKQVFFSVMQGWQQNKKVGMIAAWVVADSTSVLARICSYLEYIEWFGYVGVMLVLSSKLACILFIPLPYLYPTDFYEITKF